MENRHPFEPTGNSNARYACHVRGTAPSLCTSRICMPPGIGPTRASARAAVLQAEATVDMNQTDLRKAAICSPINGIVITRSVEPGQTVASSLQAPVLFTLAEDLTQMELQVDVDEADVGKVQQNQNASFTVDAYPGQVFHGQVTQIRKAAINVQNVVTYDAVVSVGPLECMPNKIAESQFHHVSEREGLLSLTLSLNGDPVDPEILDAFAFGSMEDARRNTEPPCGRATRSDVGSGCTAGASPMDRTDHCSSSTTSTSGATKRTNSCATPSTRSSTGEPSFEVFDVAR